MFFLKKTTFDRVGVTAADELLPHTRTAYEPCEILRPAEVKGRGESDLKARSCSLDTLTRLSRPFQQSFKLFKAR